MNFEIQIKNWQSIIAGREDLDFLILTCLGSKIGASHLRVAGMISNDPNKSEHLIWMDEKIEIDTEFTVLIMESQNYSHVLQSYFSDPASFQKRIQEKLTKINKKSQIKLQHQLFDAGLYFRVKINNEDPIDAHIYQYEQIQLRLLWNKENQNLLFDVTNIDDKEKKNWINRDLHLGDKIFVSVQGNDLGGIEGQP